MISRAVFGIDPALRCCGLAVHVNGALAACASLSMPETVNELPIGMRIDVVAERCVAWWADVEDRFERLRELATPGGDAGFLDVREPIVVYEKPQIYGGPRSADPNDLLHVGMVAASVWTRMRLRGCTELLTPTPAEWTGGLKKAKTKDGYWASRRGKHLARRVTPAERELIGDSHDAADAASLTLYAVGRWEAVRVNARPSGPRPSRPTSA